MMQDDDNGQIKKIKHVKCKNYCNVTLDGVRGSVQTKALVDTGNNVIEETAINHSFHEKLGVGFKNKTQQLIGTAGAGSRIKKIGLSNPIKLKFKDSNRTFEINPTVIENLSDTLNIGDRFLSTLSKEMPCEILYSDQKKQMRLGEETIEMIQVMDPGEQEITRGRLRGRTPACQREIDVPMRHIEYRRPVPVNFKQGNAV